MVSFRRLCGAPRRPSYEGRGLKLHNRGLGRGKIGRPSYEGRGLKLIPKATQGTGYSRPSYEGRGLK